MQPSRSLLLSLVLLPIVSVVAAAVLLATSASAVNIDWVPVGNPGNAADPLTGFGAVPYAYYMGKYDVTNTQYTAFLNAVDPSGANTLGLYSTGMNTDIYSGGITNTGPLGFVYQAKRGFENKPVTYVSFWDAVRFANWLNNGQGSGKTEAGAYTMTADGILNNTITRNPGARVFVPGLNEWYKAAYYDRIGNQYFVYPGGSNTPMVCAAPSATPNTANCSFIPTDVGAYTGSPSPNGTFDQAGNVLQWTDTIGLSGNSRSLRGQQNFAAGNGTDGDPGTVLSEIGFRVATLVPEPGTGLLVMTGLLGLAARRRRA